MSMYPKSHRADDLRAQDIADQRARIQKIEDEANGVWSQFGVSSWERARLADWAIAPYKLTNKQENILRAIEVKVFGGDDEDS